MPRGKRKRLPTRLRRWRDPALPLLSGSHLSLCAVNCGGGWVLQEADKKQEEKEAKEAAKGP